MQYEEAADQVITSLQCCRDIHCCNSYWRQNPPDSPERLPMPQRASKRQFKA